MIYYDNSEIVLKRARVSRSRAAISTFHRTTTSQERIITRRIRIPTLKPFKAQNFCENRKFNFISGQLTAQSKLRSARQQ